MTDVVYINEAEGRKRLMNNGKLYAKILTKFVADTNLEDLVALAKAEEWEKAQASAHALKGVAANLSLIELFNQAAALEIRIKEKAVNLESLENLRSCFSKTLAQVEIVIAQYA